MVNAIRIEIIGHFTKAVFPPGEAFLLYGKPVVSGKSPILTEKGKVVGRRAGLRVHIEKMRGSPGIDAVAIDSDRNISFQCNTLAVSIFLNFVQLLVEQILQERIIIDTVFCIGIGFDKLLQFFLVVNGELAPIGKSCSSHFVAQITICGIGKEPEPIFFVKSLVFFRYQNCIFFLFKKLRGVSFLQTQHIFIIKIGQFI